MIVTSSWFNVYKIGISLIKNTAIVSILAILVYASSPNIQAKDGTSIQYSPYVDDNFPRNIYWGDTHLHTSLSFDAYGDGNTKMGSDVAYEFARGKVIKGHDGVNLDRIQVIKGWVDPDFEPTVSSFYYVRVLEIPTPRWAAFDALRYKIDMPEEVTMVIQERASTSPIWYTPEK